MNFSIHTSMLIQHNEIWTPRAQQSTENMVALTGIEPAFAGFFSLLQVAETTKAGFTLFTEISPIPARLAA
jgi:hypothetical protein